MGAGRLRHVNVGKLWIQEKIYNKSITATKVKGTTNTADVFTKPSTAECIDHMMDKNNFIYE